MRVGGESFAGALAVRAIVEDTGGPRGIGAVGHGESDVPALVEGTMKQTRLLACCPRPAGPGELAAILRASLGP